MTLGGLAAAIGLVIDDAIVVVENIVLHRDAGENRIEAVRKALKEISRPLIGSTITPVVVFLPLIAVTGVTGSFFRALAITMTVSLLTSLLLAVTWTPGLGFVLLKRRADSDTEAVCVTGRASEPGSVLSNVMRWHRSALDWSLARPASAWLDSACCWSLGTFVAYPVPRLGLAAGDGRGRFYPRLHHARGQLTRRDQPRARATSNRFCANSRRSRAPAAAPDCRWASPP